MRSATKNPAMLPVLLVLLCCALFTGKAHALVLTSYFETVLVPNVSTSWTTVSLDNTYVDPIIVCTYVLGTFAGTAPNYTNLPAVTRVTNIGSSSFDLRIQGWENSSASPNDVHCLVMDEGVHTLPDGRAVEAHKVLSDQTSGQYSTDGAWNQTLLEDVSASIGHSYTAPVVLGQVMSYNDTRASVIYVTDCDTRQNHPFHAGMADGICVGKHIGMIAGSRNPETIGYIVAEAGSGTVNNVFYELALGADTVSGNNGANTGQTYAVAAHHTTAILTQAAEDGGNGSWAVLYGSTPLTAGTLGLVVDEEIVERDVSRNHTREPVYYWAFSGAEITLVKQVINDDGGTATLSDFVLSATGPNTVSGISGTPSATKVVVQPGTYIVAETSVPGYTASAWVCTGASTTSGSKIELKSGDHATCTIINDDDKFSTLTLEKVVTNDSGGAAVVGDFLLEFSGAGVSGSGVTGDAAITDAAVPPGSYVLSESSLTGYVLESIKCDGADSDGIDGVDIKPGEKVTCVFFNDDDGVDLTIGKTVNDTSPNIGDTVTFTLLVGNSGPDPAADLTVLDLVPAGFTYVASSIGGGDVADDSSPAGTGLSWIINSLPAGASTSLTFQAVVQAP